jgi:hypothetical protein
MGWKYEPPPPDTEATNMLSAYKERLRSAESRDQLEVNLDPRTPASSPFNRAGLRNRVSQIVARLRHPRRASERDSGY